MLMRHVYLVRNEELYQFVPKFTKYPQKFLSRPFSRLQCISDGNSDRFLEETNKDVIYWLTP